MNISKFDNLYNKKILITGASGIVGFNLCKELKKIPCEIHINYLNDLDINFKELDDSIIHHQFDITNIEIINKESSNIPSSNYTSLNTIEDNSLPSFKKNSSFYISHLRSVRIYYISSYHKYAIILTFNIIYE